MLNNEALTDQVKFEFAKLSVIKDEGAVVFVVVGLEALFYSFMTCRPVV